MATGGVGHLDGSALELGRGHLAGGGALEYQFVELGMIAGTGAVAAEIGGADRFMRFLRILRLALILARLVGQIAAVEALGDGGAGGGDGGAVHLHAVGPHVGDQAVLIETLCDAHGVAGGKAELARRLLLQAAGGEGWRRVAGGRLDLDRGNGEAPALDRSLGAFGGALIADGHAVDLVAIEFGQPREEGRAGMFQPRNDRPIFLRFEGLDLTLAIDDDAQRHRLDAACRFRARQLAPQHRGKGEADEIIERATGAIGVDQILVERTRGGHRLGHRRLGDGVEGDAVDFRR